MISTFTVAPAVRLRCYTDTRFKRGCLSVQLVRPMCREEAAYNALLPAVLLRGCEKVPDMQAITCRLDELYGAAVSTSIRRMGDVQTTGFFCSFMDDRFAFPGDKVLEPMVSLLAQLLLEPRLENGCFLESYVESEKRNLISTLESELNDKRSYAGSRLMKQMCEGDSFSISRLGEKEDVESITAASLFRHYQTCLSTSDVELFYVGSAPAEQIAALMQAQFGKLCIREPISVCQTPFLPRHPYRLITEQMDLSQAKLCMGFITPITVGHPLFAAMQVLNVLYGGGATSKLFLHLREEKSLCYYATSTYYATKGILTVASGIETGNYDAVRAEILAQLEACCRLDITPPELDAAKTYALSSLRSTYDTPGAIENYFMSASLTGVDLTPEAYGDAISEVTLSQVGEAARSLSLNTEFFLRGQVHE